MSRAERLRKRRIRFLLALSSILLLLCFLLHRQITKGVFSPLVKGAYYQVETKDKAVALTFEVVWEPAFTAEVLDILDRYKIRSTFFLTGSWLRQNPDLAREIIERGHEIGQHGYSHKHLTELDDEQLKQEFDLMAEALQEELNVQTSLFRPPYGELDQRVFAFAAERGYTTVVWSINPHDWREPGKDKIISRITKQLHKGAIILLHTNSSQTVEALPVIIQSLLMQEYEILTFTELAKRGRK